MKKLILISAILTCGVTSNVNASLASNAVLDFNDGTVFCPYGGTAPDACNHGVTNVNGSYFGMDTSGDQVIQNGEKNALTSAGIGLTLGSAQGVGEFDQTWSFGNPGNFFHTGVTVATASGNAATIDMAGWGIFWNGAVINMLQWPDATVICGVDCSVGDTFILDYAESTPAFSTFLVTLHLEGVITSPVPIPAAVWLFGSGLIGLIGFARRKK